MDNFIWTDELVKEYAEASKTTTIEWFKKFHNGYWKEEPKVKLFTTEDGVDVFPDARVWHVSKENFVIDFHDFDTFDFAIKDKYWYFSTLVAAENWVLANKPIQVSYKELWDYVEMQERPVSPLAIRIKDFFKTKINP